MIDIIDRFGGGNCFIRVLKALMAFKAAISGGDVFVVSRPYE